MSVTGGNSVGIPILLLHDTQGAEVTIELKDGCTYHGLLEECQDNMNCTLKNASRTDLEGNSVQLAMAYIRGSEVLFFVVPEMLKHAPFFNRIKIWRKHRGKFIMGGGDAWMREKFQAGRASGNSGNAGARGLGTNKPGRGPSAPGFGIPGGPPPQAMFMPLPPYHSGMMGANMNRNAPAPMVTAPPSMPGTFGGYQYAHPNMPPMQGAPRGPPYMPPGASAGFARGPMPGMGMVPLQMPRGPPPPRGPQ